MKNMKKIKNMNNNEKNMNKNEKWKKHKIKFEKDNGTNFIKK